MPKSKNIYHQKGYWNNHKRFMKKLFVVIANPLEDGKGNIIKNAGEFPTQPQLYKSGNSDLSCAISRKYGGFIKMKEMLGYKSYRKPDGYYKSFKNLEKELKPIISSEYKDKSGKIIKKRGEFPKIEFLNSIGRSDIPNGAIKYHKGMRNVKKKIKNLIDIIEEYVAKLPAMSPMVRKTSTYLFIKRAPLHFDVTEEEVKEKLKNRLPKYQYEELIEDLNFS